MKKFITDIRTLAALLMAGAAFTACSSDDNIIEQPQNPTEPQVYTMVIKASKGGDTTTRALQPGYDDVLGKNTVDAYWSGNETIEVYQSGEKIGTATAAPSADGNTTVTATLTSAPNPSSDLNFYLGGGIFDYTGQVGLLTGTGGNSISEKYDYNTALLYSGNFTVDGNTITLTGSNPKLNFENPEQAIVKFTLLDKADGTTAINATKLNIHDSKADGLAQSINKYNTTWTYGDVTISPATTNVIYAALSGVYQSNLTLTARAGDNVYSYSKSGVDFNSGKYYDITVKMNKILARLNTSNVSDVAAGGYTAKTAEEAATLVKECWTVAGGKVYVVYNIASYMVYYVITEDGETTTNSSISAMQASTLYAEGSTAWFVEPAPASSYKMAADATTDDKGKLICTEGHIHAYNADAECTATRVAKIIYIGTTGHATYSHGLALALTDEASRMLWQDAIDACSAKNSNSNTRVTDATWLLASKDQWNYMLGTDGAGSYTALRDGFSGITGADNLQSSEYPYWSSTEMSSTENEYNPDHAWFYHFGYGNWYTGEKGHDSFWVRACLAF